MENLKNRPTKLTLAVLAALSAGTTVISPPVLAQVAAQQLEEVLITSTRRTTDVQDVPLAVTALSAESLQAQNIENLEDLTAIVPNVLIAGGNGGTTSGSFYMRGIPNVGVYLDGIWQVSSNGLLTRDFVELDRVEVLRGPQGTLYGRDSTGGSIHLFSKAPGDEFAAELNVGTGNLGRRDAMASVDIPLGETLRTKWTLGNYSQDGWVKSLTTGINAGWMDSKVFRGDILWMPMDKLSFRLIHQIDDQVGQQARVQARIDPAVGYFHGYQVGIGEAHDIASGGKFNPKYAVAGYPGGQLGEYESRLKSTMPNEQYLDQTTLHADFDISDTMHLKYMYGKSRNDSSIYNDWGGSEFNFFVNYDTTLLDMESHELQLTGNLFGGGLDYVVGYYAWEQESRNRGVEWTMQDWTLSAANSGTIKTLDYAKVLASPACTTRTPASVGRDFTGQANWLGQIITGKNSINDWPFPCNWAGGNGWIGAFAGPGGGVTSDRLNGQTQDGDAFFGEVTWYINDRWDVTAGFRSHDQDNVAIAMSPAKLAANIKAGFTEARPIELNTLFRDRGDAVSGPLDVLTPQSFSADTYRFATTYDINDDFMIYAGYSEGFNSGGISQYEDSVGPVSISYAPEIIENWEIGMRADLLEGMLRANATYFDTDWLGIQYLGTVIDRATKQEATELVLQNTANGYARGVELELTYLATNALTLGATLGFLDTGYTSINPGAPLPKDSAFARAPDNTYMLSGEYDWGNNVFGGNL
ncbi:MAG: TonB-dependent receptor, partial [Pseudohongiellaceae bacterium]